MSVNIKTLMLEVVKSTLEVAKRQSEKQRPIDNICPESICNRFFTEKEESMSLDNNTYIYWLTAFIESDVGLDEAVELDQIVKWIKDGFSSFSDAESDGSGQFSFEIFSKE
jgi:hypothetical protein